MSFYFRNQKVIARKAEMLKDGRAGRDADGDGITGESGGELSGQPKVDDIKDVRSANSFVRQLGNTMSEHMTDSMSRGSREAMLPKLTGAVEKAMQRVADLQDSGDIDDDSAEGIMDKLDELKSNAHSWVLRVQ